MRYGRVLSRLGRDEQAATELHNVIESLNGLDTTTPESKGDSDLLQYFAGLFLGSAEEALGHFDLAQTAYARSAALFPRSQSARLALSQLSRRLGKREAALDSIDSVFHFRNVDDETDPWWGYYRSQGRHVDDLLEDLGRPFLTVGAP